VDEVGLEPTMPQGGRFTVFWGYQFSYTSITDLAGPLGIEPRIAESKSVVIPFHYEPTKTWSG
jgi:hypothetical protein